MRSTLALLRDALGAQDTHSLDLLSYAGRRWSILGAPVLLLFAGRSEDLHALGAGASRTAPGLADWLAGMQRDVSLSQVVLGPLTREDTEQLLAALVATPMLVDEPISTAPDASAPPRSFSQWLFGETGGQPFFMLETLKSLAERDLLRRNEAGTWTIAGDIPKLDSDAGRFVPAGVQELIRARLRRLAPAGLIACAACAVLGDESDFDMLCRVGGLNETDGLSAVETLLQRGLLRESNGRYFFAHDTLREVTYTEISHARRRVYHRRALEALEATAAPPIRLVRHALAARLSAPAFRYSLAAGDDALRLFAVRDAIAQYEQARRLLDDGACWRD